MLSFNWISCGCSKHKQACFRLVTREKLFRNNAACCKSAAGSSTRGPHVDAVGVAAGSQQNLRRPVPPGGNVVRQDGAGPVLLGCALAPRPLTAASLRSWAAAATPLLPLGASQLCGARVLTPAPVEATPTAKQQMAATSGAHDPTQPQACRRAVAASKGHVSWQKVTAAPFPAVMAQESTC